MYPNQYLQNQFFALKYLAQFADATKEIGLVQTVSFFDNPIEKHALCNALVALLKPNE